MAIRSCICLVGNTVLALAVLADVDAGTKAVVVVIMGEAKMATTATQLMNS